MEQTISIIGSDKKVSDELFGMIGEFPDFCCVSVSSDHEEALNSLLKYNPSIVFLDLDSTAKMQDAFCFANELHHYLEELPAFVGFSSSKELAYEAIKHNFLDFLLKPLSESEMRKCLMKFQKNRKKKNSERICLKSYSDYRFINFKDILYLKADNNTTDFYLTQGRKISAYKTLKHFEELLPQEFLRVHHSYIINTRQVVRINYGKSLIALREQATAIPFSKSYKLHIDHLKENLVTSFSIVS